MSFVELSALSNFTFLTGASHPEELVERAHALVGAMLFTLLGVVSARHGQWLTAAGLIVAAGVFGIGGVRAKT